jgi:23S rRNA C2498 (ribose-2'-O)-methylase RlmM
MRSSYDTDASVLLDSLRWDNLSLRRQKLKLGLMFKTLKSNDSLQEFFSIRGTGYNLRNSEMRLNLSKPRTNYLKRSFCFSGALLWNSLPQEIRKLQTQAKF